MIMTKLDNYTIEKIEKFKGILDKGLHCNGAEVTMTYNAVFGTNLAPTNCASCVRHRIGKMYAELQRIRRLTDKET